MLSLFLLNRIIHTNIKEIYRGQGNCRNSADETVYRDESQASRCDIAFRVGDFYETFSDDALVASEILGITLTRRANGAAQYVELAGFPHHALDTYLPKLVRAGNGWLFANSWKTRN